MSISDLREDYRQSELQRSDLLSDPVAQFEQWFEAVLQAGVKEPNAMTLATVDDVGQASARIVLLKGVEKRGFQFFTNYRSRKAQHLADQPYATLVFHWRELERQVTIGGVTEKMSREDSLAYFRTRPRGSRLGAWASPQSEVIPERDVLENALRELETKYPGDDIPMPDWWGGFRLVPDRVEFWQGRSNRLHDRFVYTRTGPESWEIKRLAP
jgi:pyridoxamine 5'-phosphate oxidase